MARKLDILFGPPGTGKTTACLEILNEALARGVGPQAIAFLAFSRAAAREAQIRLGVTTARYVRTIHSLAYTRLGLSRNRVMGRHHWCELADTLGLVLSNYEEDLERVPPAWAKGSGDKCLRIVGLAAATRQSLEEVWYRQNYDNLELQTVIQFHEELTRFKKRLGLTDFTDMLELDQAPLEDVELLVIDEAQDLTPQQWVYVRRLAAKVPHVVLAGDDDQAIYEWSGADPVGMLRFTGNVRVLPKSHRLSASGHRVAQEISEQITVRQHKVWRGREELGVVQQVNDISDVDLSRGSWLVLARHRYQLKEMEREVRQQGVPYELPDGRSSLNDDCVRAVFTYERLRQGGEATSSQVKTMLPFLGRPMPEDRRESWTWDTLNLGDERPTWLEGMRHLSLEDREYVRSLRRAGFSFKEKPKVRLQTVHGAKGWEADNVVLATDISRTLAPTSDAELRVAYVGATRAREGLYLVRRRTPHGWSLS